MSRYVAFTDVGRALLAERGWSAATLARRTGVVEMTAARCMRGYRVRVATASAVLRGLGITGALSVRFALDRSIMREAGS